MYFFVFASVKMNKLERYFYLRLICITFCCILNPMKKLNRQKLQRKIEETGDTAFAFAKKHGFTYETLRRWLNGEREAKISNITKLCFALECPISDIADFVFVNKDEEEAELTADKEEICRIFDLISEQQRFALINMARFMIPQSNPSNK